MHETEYIKLSNGVTVILHDAAFSRKSTVAVFVNAGSNNETEKNHGISHFMEHMLFKGTKNRTSKEIVNTVEHNASEINAFTTKEKTSYYIVGPKEFVPNAIDLLHDMLFNSLFDEAEIQKEIKVVLQEQAEDGDDNLSAAICCADAVLYKDQAQGRGVLGGKNIKTFNSAILREYHSAHYVASNIVVGVSASLENKAALIAQIEKSFGTIASSKQTPKPIEPQGTTGTKIVYRPNDLSQVVLQFHLQDTVAYLNEVSAWALGIGFSSPLFEEVRERKGLSYSVGASYEKSKSHSNIIMHAAVNNSKTFSFLRSCKKIINESSKNLSDFNYERAINNVVNDLEYLYESRMAYLEYQADNLFDLGHALKIEDEIEKVKRLSKEDVKQNIANLLQEPHAIVAVGKYDKKTILTI